MNDDRRLVEEVERDQRGFAATIFWRSCVMAEAVTAIKKQIVRNTL